MVDILGFFFWIGSHFIRAAREQDEIVPENAALNRYEKRFEKRHDRIRKAIRHAFA